MNSLFSPRALNDYEAGGLSKTEHKSENRNRQFMTSKHNGGEYTEAKEEHA
ncbi:hypothetical protein [Methanosarcina sp.]|uniref:hypothetical protein n=1 Tax=Methanosarcina sp. TaxID=2213 RepID=UPI002AB83B19|nr:hypothetical protein [Methanosarcina sp.]MDY9925319.1 hypothetical protein [Methanosarcina sp.]